MKPQGAIVLLVFIGACVLAFSLPIMIAGGRLETHDDIVLVPRNTATATPLDRALTQEAFAILFFSPTPSPLVELVNTVIFTPSSTITAIVNLIVSPTPSPTRTPFAFVASTTPEREKNPFTPTFTRTSTYTPRPTGTPSASPTNTLIPSPTRTATPRPTNTLTPSPTNTPVTPTETPEPPTNTPVTPTETPEPPTNTPVTPTEPPKPSDTPVPPSPTETLAP